MGQIFSLQPSAFRNPNSPTLPFNDPQAAQKQYTSPPSDHSRDPCCLPNLQPRTACPQRNRPLESHLYQGHLQLASLLIGYDPVMDLPSDHLAWLVDRVVDEAVTPRRKADGPGQSQYDPRLCIKVILYSYATGVRSSRQMERLCRESLPHLLLTCGAAPSYRTLCSVRTDEAN